MFDVRASLKLQQQTWSIMELWTFHDSHLISLFFLRNCLLCLCACVCSERVGCGWCKIKAAWRMKTVFLKFTRYRCGNLWAFLHGNGQKEWRDIIMRWESWEICLVEVFRLQNHSTDRCKGVKHPYFCKINFACLARKAGEAKGYSFWDTYKALYFEYLMSEDTWQGVEVENCFNGKPFQKE